MLLTKIIGVIAITCLTGLGTNIKDSKRVIGDYSPTLINRRNANETGITNLTGYTWVGNEFISHDTFGITACLNYTCNDISYDKLQIYFDDFEGDSDIYYIDTTSNTSVWAHAGAEWNDTIYRTIQFTGGADSTNSTLIAWLQANGTLSLPEPEPEPTDTTDYQFIINQSPNYNGVLGYSVNSFCVIKPNTASSAQFFYDIDLPTFTSNGETYNQVRVFFGYADNIRYMNSAGELVVNTTSGLSFAQSIIYKNTETDTARTVYKRLEGYTTDNNGASLHYWTMNWSWSNEKYRTLNFTQELSSSQETELTQLNTGYSTLYINATTDVGLGGAMTLIGAGFSAVTSLLAISVFPGISLGLLLFLPLIVGIIIAVIWVVKR